MWPLTTVEKKAFKNLVQGLAQWNSLSDAVKRIVELRDQLGQIYAQLNLPKLKVFELQFLDEYAKVTEPVTRTLDRLQGDKNCFLGTLLPTLIALRKNDIQLNQHEKKQLWFHVSYKLF